MGIAVLIRSSLRLRLGIRARMERASAGAPERPKKRSRKGSRKSKLRRQWTGCEKNAISVSCLILVYELLHVVG